MSNPKRYYGARPSLPDHRNYKFLSMSQGAPPPSASFRDKIEIVDQGQIGSCTANAWGNAFRYLLTKDNVQGEKFLPSRLWLYYEERVKEGTVATDAGAQVITGAQVLRTLGAPAEHEFPYDISKFTQKAPAKVYSDASHRKQTKYMQVQQTSDQIRGALAAGFPVVFGFTVYSSFEDSNTMSTGNVSIPATSESILGGHCIFLVGYDDGTQLFTAANSWGPYVNDHGFLHFPYEYIVNPNLCFDFFAAELVRRVA